MRYQLLTLYIIIGGLTHSTIQDAGDHRHTVFILFGGTGDLAAKRLWQAVFNIHQASQTGSSGIGSTLAANHSFTILTASRQPNVIGNEIIHKVIRKVVKCQEDEHPKCEEKKSEFIDEVKYFQVRNEEGFAKLCEEISSKTMAVDKAVKLDLIMYLSIPPAAYESVLKMFHERCSSTLQARDIETKWAVEKPFGFNKSDAAYVSSQYLKFVTEEEMFRVDHFLGKAVVKEILPMRYMNHHVEKLLNKDHVEKVDIVLKEPFGCEGRTSFYNTVGVLSDIHQNHLTELLALVAMDLPLDLGDAIEKAHSKERLLQQILPVKSHSAIFGQYYDYVDHAQADKAGSSDEAVNVPTFGAVLLNVNSPRWKGVPFYLVSGKQLDTHESYIRIIFKKRHFCVSGCRGDDTPVLSGQQEQLIIQIGEGENESPSIMMSKSLGKPKWPENMQHFDMSNSSTSKSSRIYGMPSNQFWSGVVSKPVPDYESLILDLLAGRRDSFIPTKQLLLSWQVWDHIVTAPKQVKKYDEGDPGRVLNFVASETNLEFSTPDIKKSSDDDSYEKVEHLLQFSASSFLGRKLFVASKKKLAFLLARRIAAVSEAEIRKKGSFHIALSGGSSIVMLFQILAQSFSNLQWSSIHVWQVDERCVPYQDERSNFLNLDRELLRFVNIPFTHIHPMPVYTGGKLCDDELNGEHVYTESIKHSIPNTQLDFAVLGLGLDGHTASLFPHSQTLQAGSGSLITKTQDGPAGTEVRMTMTLTLLNKAKNLAVFVPGQKKKEILQMLEDASSVEQFPILGINPVNGTVEWYIDSEAYPYTLVAEEDQSRMTK